MTEEEVKQILEQIMELASILGWQAVLAQHSDGHLLGMYIGSDEFIELKRSKASGTFIH